MYREELPHRSNLSSLESLLPSVPYIAAPIFQMLQFHHDKSYVSPESRRSTAIIATIAAHTAAY
jgi:hypothetical protein